MGVYGSPENLSFLDRDKIKCTCGTIFSSNYCPTCGSNKNLLKNNYQSIDPERNQVQSRAFFRFTLISILIGLILIYILEIREVSEEAVNYFLTLPFITIWISPMALIIKKINKKPKVRIEKSILASACMIGFTYTAYLIWATIKG